MAAINSTTSRQAAMAEDLNMATAMLKGATGFLFAATMADGSIKWMAGGNLLGYDQETAGAAMQLYVEAQRASFKSA